MLVETATLEKDRTCASRRFPRLDIKISVCYSLLGRTASAEVFTAKVINISGAGVFLYTPDIFSVESRLELELILSASGGKENEPIRAEGMVIWLADKNLQPDSYPGMGIQFTRISQEDNNRLIDFIEKNAIHRADLL